MPKINPDITYHKLAIDYLVKWVQYKKRHFCSKRLNKIKIEVDKLLKTYFICKVSHRIWLSNIIMVKQLNESQKMCANFPDLNKTYPKGSYSLLDNDGLINGALEYVILSLYGAFLGNNQILIWKKGH